MASLSFDTINFFPDSRKTEDLDLAKSLKNLQLDILIDYDTIAGASVLYDAVPTSVINDLVIGGGKSTIFEVDGEDLYHVLWGLNGKAPEITPFDIAIAVSKRATMQLNIPVLLNPGQISTPKLKVKWFNQSRIGANQTINTGAVNGSYNHVERPVSNQKVLPQSQSGSTGRNKVQLDAEGRLVGIMVLTRDSATPFNLRNHITDMDLIIEGAVEQNDIRWEQVQANFMNMTDTDGPYIVGVGYLDLADRNIVIGNQSYLKWEGDATPTDVKVYQIFQRTLPDEPKPREDLVQKKTPQISPKREGRFRKVALGKSDAGL